MHRVDLNPFWCKRIRPWPHQTGDMIAAFDNTMSSRPNSASRRRWLRDSFGVAHVGHLGVDAATRLLYELDRFVKVVARSRDERTSKPRPATARWRFFQVSPRRNPERSARNAAAATSGDSRGTSWPRIAPDGNWSGLSAGGHPAPLSPTPAGSGVACCARLLAFDRGAHRSSKNMNTRT
jgi:hypothetical protein